MKVDTNVGHIQNAAHYAQTCNGGRRPSGAGSVGELKGAAAAAAAAAPQRRGEQQELRRVW